MTRTDGEMEYVDVREVTVDTDQAKITLRRIPDRVGIAARLFGAMSSRHVNIDMIVQNVGDEGRTDVSFTVSAADLAVALQAAKQFARSVGATHVQGDQEIAEVSVVGIGMRSHSGVAEKMFNALADEGINIQMISTSEIKISCVIDADMGEKALRAVHRAFELGQEDEPQ